jgi:hypothetical protein
MRNLNSPKGARGALILLGAAMGAWSAAYAEDHYTDPYILAHRSMAKSLERFGDLPLGAVIRTDERYGPQELFQPRGWDYWYRLENPRPGQDPNLWPDKRPTYMTAGLVMPAGSSLIVRGAFPHARYFKLAFYKFEHGTFVALAGESFAGWEIEPDPGSANPYRVGADRRAENRSYTLRVLADDPPKDSAARAKNTLYVGRDELPLQAVFRVYVSDESYDGPGWASGDAPSTLRGLSYEGELADGTKLSAEEVVKRFNRPMGFAPQQMPTDQWYRLVDATDNDPSLTPETAPARKDPVFEKFWTVRYSLVGAFKSPEVRAKIPYAGQGVQAGADPGTAYLIAYISRKFGPVFVMRGKMPTFPEHLRGRRQQGPRDHAGCKPSILVCLHARLRPLGRIVGRRIRHAGAARQGRQLHDRREPSRGPAEERDRRARRRLDRLGAGGGPE